MTTGKPHSTPLSERAEVLFADIRAIGEGWHSRAAISKRIGRKRLNIYDVALLDFLVEMGKLEVMQQEAPGPIGYQWLYRVKGEEEQGK